MWWLAPRVGSSARGRAVRVRGTDWLTPPPPTPPPRPSAQAFWAVTGLNVYLVAKAASAARTGMPGPPIDGMAHLAGSAVGALAYLAARRREEARRRTHRGGGGAAAGW